MRDLVEAGLDVALDDPLVRAGRQVAHLGHRVVRAAIRAEPVGAQVEVRLEDRLQHQLQGSLDHPVGDGGDPQAAQFPARLGDHPLPHRQRAEAAVFHLRPQHAEEIPGPLPGLDGTGSLPVHPGRARSLVAPHPVPRNQKKRRIGDEVEQIIEPAMRIIAGPAVQLGLDIKYPALRFEQGGSKLVGTHRRHPPDFPVLPLRLTGLLRHVRASRARTTTRPPSRPAAVSRQRACPPPGWLPGGKSDRRRFPRSPRNRSRS